MKKTLLYKLFAVGLLLTASIGAFAQVTSGAHKYTLTGVTIEQAAALTGDDEARTVYLLNVGKYQNATSKNDPAFIGRGQAWGTEIIISNIPLPLTVETTTTTDDKGNKGYLLKTNIKENGQSNTGYIGFITDANDAHAYFNDRGTSDNSVAYFVTPENSTITNAYMIKHHLDNESYGHVAGDYYAAALYNPHGTDNPNREDHVNGFLDSQLQAAKQEVSGEEYIDNNDDLWMLITRQQLKEYFGQVDAAQNDPAIATFLIADPDFARADTEVHTWQTETVTSTGTATGTLQNDIESDYRKNSDKNGYYGPRSKSYFSSTSNQGIYGFNNYYVGNGWQTDASGDGVGQRDHGGKWTANILGQGKVYQNISLDGLRRGWYAVRVSATTFRNKDANQLKDSYVKLYASSGDKKAESYIATDTNDPQYFINAEPIVNDGKHEASVLIYIGDQTTSTLPANTTLTIGIDASDTHLNNDEDPAGRAWTCFDNFQLWYLGDPKNKVLLDEDETDIDYINKQNTYVNHNNLSDGNTGTRTKSTVYLRRTLNANKWNTIVLPFSIEEDVVLQTFGSGTVYAVLEGATDQNNPNTIFFNRDFDGMEKGKLYLIKPTNSQPTGQDDVYASSQSDGQTSATSASDAIRNFTSANGKNSYWTFEAVDFGNDNDAAYDANFHTAIGNETAGSGTVWFAGTYINHGETGFIPPCSYVLSGKTTSKSQAGTWYYRGDNTYTKTKGFRGWLQTQDPTTTKTETPTKAANAIFNVDGDIWPTEGTVTGIDNLTIDGKKIVIRDNDIYNLQGQRVRRGTSLEGLAKGIYVINGKKVLVK